MEYALLFGGIYLVLFALIVNTKNLSSMLVFKIMPALIGIVCLFEAMTQLGYIVKI